jgi:hypothetical protein
VLIGPRIYSWEPVLYILREFYQLAHNATIMRGILQRFVLSFMGLWHVALVPNYWTAEKV